MRKLIIPLLALIIFIGESVLANVFSGYLYGGTSFLIPRMTVIFIAFLTIYGSRKTAFMYAFILGLLYDVAYTEILGVYTFAFPVAAYVISKIMKILQSNLLISGLITLLFIAVIEAAVYQLNILLGFTSVDFRDFSMLRLVPTLLLNLVFIVITAYPLRRTIESLRVDSEGE